MSANYGRTVCNYVLMLLLAVMGPVVTVAGLAGTVYAQAQAAAAAARQIGTVKAIAGSTMTLTTDAGQAVTVSVVDGARILQIEPGSKDLKSAQAIALADIAVGDRVLVSGKAGDTASALAASRVILMKSTDIAQKHALEQADWQKRGTGGIVSSVDAATGTVVVTAGAKKIQVQTGKSTIFRRYAGDSIKFEDAKLGTIEQIQSGDQLRVRGTKSEDGSSLQAEEVVSGSFKNLAGTIATLDASAGTITLKDLATKKMMTVKVTGNSDLRHLPERAAAMFAARAKGGAAAAGVAGAGVGHAGAAGAGAAAGAGTAAGAGEGATRSAGMDLSQMLAKLPSETVADLKVGDAVMIVASQAEAGSTTVTAVTLLSGVEPILAATPSGTPAMTLSPWTMGGAASEGGN